MMVVILIFVALLLLGWVIFDIVKPYIVYPPAEENLIFIPCKNSKYADLVENLSYYFNGIIYNKPILVCLKVNNTAYCIQSEYAKTLLGNILYFTSCYFQTSIDENLEKVIVDINYLKELEKGNFIEKLKEGKKEGKVIISDNLLKALEKWS